MKPISDPDDEEHPSSDFAQALEAFERGDPRAVDRERAALEYPVGARVRGRVVGLTNEHALIDIGARSEAIADLGHFRRGEEPPRVELGDVVEMFVVDAGDPVVLAPALRADPESGLAALRDAQRAGIPVSGRVIEVNAGGLRVDVGGGIGFCPVSQIEAGFCSDPSSYRGHTLEFLVTGFDSGRRNVTLSRRALLERRQREEAERRIASLEVGQEVEGTIKHLESFGAFVDLGGVEALVHVSEIQHARVAHPRDVLVEGQRIRARLLRLETGKDGRSRIGLSIKAAAPDPWDGIERRLPVGARVRGVVARLAEFGAFVTLEPGVDGLVHVSEIAPQRIERVKDALAVGQEIEALVLGVDARQRRIALSIKAAAHDREDRAQEPAPAASPASDSTAAEPTTMALAFRRAAEKARRKQG